MADKDPSISGLNLFGAETPDIQEYVRAREEGLKALEQRYANPNWFNVAAGFFKPQLGGFGASLGSAGQALGDWQEKQRESVLPVARMRSELALAKIALGQKMKAADLAQKAISGGAPTLGERGTVTALGGEGTPTAQALTGMIGGRLADLETAAKTLAVNNAGFATELTNLNELAKLEQLDPAARAEKLKGLLAKWQGALAPVAKPAAITPSGINVAAAAPAGGAAIPAPAAAAGAVTPADVSLAGSDAAFDAAMKPTVYTGTPLSAEQIKSYEQRAAKGDTLAEDILRAYRASPAGAEAEKTAPKAAAPSAGKADANAPLPTQYKKTFGVTFRNANDADQVAQNATDVATAKDENERVKKEFEPYRYLAQDTVKNSTESAFSSVKQMYANPKVAEVVDRISDAVKSAGVLAVIASQGTSANVMGYGMQLSIPVRDAILATLPKEDRAIAAQYMDGIGTIASADLYARGRIPTDKDIIDAAGLNRPYSAQYSNVERAKHRFDHAVKTNDVILRELDKAKATGSLAPYAEIKKQSQELRALNRVRDKRIEAVDRAEVSAMGSK